MDLKVNSLSFQAKISNLTEIKNKSAFKKICKEFEQRTLEYPGDMLYITKSKRGADSWHITDKMRGDFYKGEEIFTSSIDEHINELGVKNFTNELVNAFKAMKTEREIYKKAKPTKIELDKIKGQAKAFEKIAAAYENDKNELMAKRYRCLSERCNDKKLKLISKFDKYVNKFKSKIDELSKDFPEIKQVELYFT